MTMLRYPPSFSSIFLFVLYSQDKVTKLEICNLEYRTLNKRKDKCKNKDRSANEQSHQKHTALCNHLTRPIGAPNLSASDSINPSRGPEPTPAALYIPPPIPMIQMPSNIKIPSSHVLVAAGRIPDQ